MQRSEDTIRVVLGVYDPDGSYSRHAGVVMTSIFLNTKSKVSVCILHDATLTQQNQTRFQQTAGMFGQTVEFVDVTEHVERLGKNAVQTAGEFLSVGCLFRLLIPDLLPYTKVIYLDCDVLVNLDIRELWDIEISEYCIAGVRDPMVKKKKRIFSRDFLITKLLHIDLADYINSGVLVMNLEKIRETCDLAKEALAYFVRYRHCAPPIDQNFINFIFNKKCRLLDARFNRNSTEPGDERAILHVMGKPKPWQGFNDAAAGRIYWKTCMQTAWREETLDAVLHTAFNSPLNHRKMSQCYKKIMRRLYLDIVARNLTNLKSIFYILFTECAYRMKARIKG